MVKSERKGRVTFVRARRILLLSNCNMSLLVAVLRKKLGKWGEGGWVGLGVGGGREGEGESLKRGWLI